MKKFPGELTKERSPKGVMHYVLTDEQREWLVRWYPTIENGRLMKASGMTHSTLHRFARDLGLRKSEKGLHGIMVRQGSRVREMLEENGYYDTLRGKPLSEATLEGTRRMWQEIREGRREPPVLALKRSNPRRYRECMKRKGEARKELVRAERRRGLFGLERKTKLNIPVDNYTKRQTSHRYNALKRGYFVMADCREGSGERFNIYYDDETVRSDLFERNLQADGFRVIRYSD